MVNAFIVYSRGDRDEAQKLFKEWSNPYGGNGHNTFDISVPE